MSYTFQCYTQVVGDSFEDLADASFAARSDKVLSSSYHDGDQDAIRHTITPRGHHPTK